MVSRKAYWLPILFAALVPNVLHAQSARDAFWSASDLISVTPNPAGHARPKVRTAPSPPRNLASAADAPSSPSQAQGPRETQVAELVATNGYGAAPHLVRASESRLGLRCSIMLRGADKQYSEVTPGTVFHSGDHIRLSFLANEPGYFYVIQQGSTGAWKPIYPPPDATPETSRIEAGKLQIVPAGNKTFLFDQNPGNEKLYVILSRTPIDDIDRAVRSLRSGQSNPAPQPEATGAELEAKNIISDAFVSKLASRDLALVDEEKVDESSTPAHSSEKAIYVVNKESAPQDSSQVVLSLELRHE
ncbi:MAG TPA: DUF4384 domain-containing protein [Terracidiphilus sp.]|jgi:hypothetical protein